MIINAYLRKQRLRKMHRDSTWCANPLCRSLGSFATPWDIKITTELRDSRPLANPLGSSPGRFAKKRESALMPLSPGNIFCYKPPIKPVGSPWGCPGVYPLGWPLIPAWTAMKYVNDSIKLSPYHQFCCPVSLISTSSSANIPVSPRFFARLFGEFTWPAILKKSIRSQFYAAN